MNSLSEIKNILNDIAIKHGLNGISVELAKDLLAQSIYYTLVDKSSLIFKNSIDTTNNVNAITQYALTNLYPIFRGKNAIIRIYGVWSNQLTQYKRGQLAYSSKNFNLYFARDYGANTLNPDGTVNTTAILHDGHYIRLDQDNNYEPQVPVTYIDLIVSKNFVSDRQFSNNNPFYVESVNDDNISEDVQVLSKLNNSSGVYQNLPFTKFLDEHVDDIQLNKSNERVEFNSLHNRIVPLLLTSYNYSIRLYPGLCDRIGESNKLKMDYSQYLYQYNYFPYYEYNPQYSEIEGLSIDGFQTITGYYLKTDDGSVNELIPYNVDDFIQSSLVDEENNKIPTYGIHLIKYVEREGINDGLPYKIQTNLLAIQKLRSSHDLTDVFNKFFEKEVYNSSYEFSNDSAFPSINIKYIPRSPSIDLSSSEYASRVQEFKNKKAYYFNCDIGYITAATPFTIELKIQLYSSDNVNLEDVKSIINKYQYQTKTTIALQELLAEIGQVDRVKYAVLRSGIITTKDNSNNDIKIPINLANTDSNGLTYLCLSNEPDENNYDNNDALENDKKLVLGDRYIDFDVEFIQQLGR